MLVRVLGVGVGLLLLIGLVLVVSSYTFLPSVVEGVLAREIQGRIGLETVPEVALNSEPPPSILAGKFASGRVVLKDANFEEIRPDRVAIDLNPFDLDLLGSISSRALESQGPLSGKLQMDLSEKEVARLANQGNQGPRVESVRLEPDRMTVNVETSFMGMNVPASVVGTLDLRVRTLVFAPRGISAFGVRLPQKLSDQLVSQARFQYPLEDLPYDTDVSDVRVEEGKVVVEGTIGRIPVGKADGTPSGTPDG